MKICPYLPIAFALCGLLMPRSLSANDIATPGVWITSHEKVDFGEKSLLDIWDIRANGVGYITLEMVLYRNGKAQPVLTNSYYWMKIPESEQKWRLYFLRKPGNAAAFQMAFPSGEPQAKGVGNFDAKDYAGWPKSFPQQFSYTKSDAPYAPGKKYVLYGAASDVDVSGVNGLLFFGANPKAENLTAEMEKYSRAHKAMTLLAVIFEWRKEYSHHLKLEK